MADYMDSSGVLMKEERGEATVKADLSANKAEVEMLKAHSRGQASCARAAIYTKTPP